MRRRDRGRGKRGGARRAVRMLQRRRLLLLQHCPAHGYNLLGQLDEFGLGDLDSSMVYRALRDMEERGWVTSTWDQEQAQGPPRRVYCLSKVGDKVLAVCAQDLEEARRRIDHLLSVYRSHMAEAERTYHSASADEPAA